MFSHWIAFSSSSKISLLYFWRSTEINNCLLYINLLSSTFFFSYQFKTFPYLGFFENFSLDSLYFFLFIYFLSLTQGDVHWLQRERKRKRETSAGCLSYAPWLRIKPKTLALTRNRAHNPLLYGTTLQPTEPPDQGLKQFCHMPQRQFYLFPFLV